MRILFIHQNFPGQFKHLAPALVAQGHKVVAFALTKAPGGNWNGIQVLTYQPTRGNSNAVHPWLVDLETKLIRGEAALSAAIQLQQQGFNPDLIIAHPGWGESLFLKSLWPNAKLALYCEFFYHARGADVDFDPEFPVNYLESACRLQMKNANHLLHFDVADAGICPTYWQASTFPESFRNKIKVVHDGIDTAHIKPNPEARLGLTPQLTLTRADEVITFVSRTLEPYRGYHIFMRCLPELLARRPDAQVLIVGNDESPYGARAENGQTWREIFFNEVKHRIAPEDLQRVHFLGRIRYDHFITLLQLSTVHLYLTYPFVLSWSLLEAMSAGCTIVASDTQPLHEAIKHNETGRLVNFFNQAEWVQQICALLDNPAERQRLSDNARAFAVANYDLKTVCLPQQLEWVEQLLKG